MTREEAKSCIGTIEMLQRLAYNIHGVMDVIDADNCKKIIKALEQEPTTKNDCAEQNGCVTCSLDDGDDCCRKLYEESIQEPTTKNDLGVDCISREQAKVAIRDKFKDIPSRVEINTILNELPSVTPQEPRWIPLTKRPMTDEETKHYFEYTDMRIDDTYTILDCPLPDDGQEVLVSCGGYVENDVFIQDNEGCYFEGRDIDDVDAWMPKPKPYEPQEVRDKE